MGEIATDDDGFALMRPARQWPHRRWLNSKRHAVTDAVGVYNFPVCHRLAATVLFGYASEPKGITPFRQSSSCQIVIC